MGSMHLLAFATNMQVIMCILYPKEVGACTLSHRYQGKPMMPSSIWRLPILTRRCACVCVHASVCLYVCVCAHVCAFMCESEHVCACVRLCMHGP